MSRSETSQSKRKAKKIKFSLLLVKHEEKLFLPFAFLAHKILRMSLKICRRRNLCFFLFHVETLIRSEGSIFAGKGGRLDSQDANIQQKTFNVKKIEMKFHRVTKLCRFTPASTNCMNISSKVLFS